MSQCFSPANLWLYFFATDISISCQQLLSSPETLQTLAFWSYIFLFVLTVLLEAPFYLYLGRKQWLSGLIIANLLTHPAVTFVFPAVFARFEISTAVSLLVCETFAIIAEALFIRFWWKQKWTPAFAISLTANIFSWWIGTLLPESWF